MAKLHHRVRAAAFLSQNHLRAVFEQQGILLPPRKKAWWKEGMKFIAKHARPLAKCGLEEIWPGQVHLEWQALTHLQAQLKRVERKLDELAAANKQVQLLQTTLGIGRCSAEVIVAFLDDPKRFRNGRQVSSYSGLTPKQ